jgi:colicin import membrane protein
MSALLVDEQLPGEPQPAGLSAVTQRLAELKEAKLGLTLAEARAKEAESAYDAAVAATQETERQALAREEHRRKLEEAAIAARRKSDQTTEAKMNAENTLRRVERCLEQEKQATVPNKRETEALGFQRDAAKRAFDRADAAELDAMTAATVARAALAAYVGEKTTAAIMRGDPR